ncbi:MAG: LytTR family transcriptional regulator DNA-binding domain-containing protein [Crocinitomicaceae bacterium]|nr:LytTR family transcriptional regulator DNA-binding domain-containing protein [Crocinitomicaceae bacterium]
MKKVIIIDDEPLARSIIKSYLSKHKDLEIIEECNNGFEGIKSIDKNKPDLIFLDIQMPKINGFEMLELIDQNPGVIFTTAFDEYAIKAFETSAIDYLLKPFTQERFDKAVQKWIFSRTSSADKEVIANTSKKQPDEDLRIVVKEGTDIKIIPTDSVLYIEAYDDYVKIHTNQKYYVKKKTMIYYEKTLNTKDFLRIHRSYIININELTRIESYEKNSYRATLKNGAKIPISRSSYSGLKEILGL